MLLLPASCVKPDRKLSAYGVSCNQKLSPTEDPGIDWKPEVNIEGARNECESFQVVIQTKSEASDLTLGLSDFKRLKGLKRERLPASLFKVAKVEWVDVKAPFDAAVPSDNPVLMPDPLLPVDLAVDRFELKPGNNLIFWITLAIPEEAAAGIYTGTIKISGADRATVSIPVNVRIREFALPDKPYLQSMVSLSSADIYRAHGITNGTDEQKKEVLRLYFNEYIRARLAPFLYTTAFNPLPGGGIRYTFEKDLDKDGWRRLTGKVILDFTGFDREGEYYFNECGAFSAFNCSPVALHKTKEGNKAYATFSDSNGETITRYFDGADKDNAVFDTLVSDYFRQLAAHLEEKGWLDRAVYYVADEPSEDDVEAIRLMCRIARQGDPRIRTAIAIRTPFPARELTDERGNSLVDIWIPVGARADQILPAEQRIEGTDLWFYDVKSYALITNSGRENRSIFWNIWRNNAHGYAYYLTTYWGLTATPWDRPNSLRPGTVYQYRFGDGYFFYPPLKNYNPSPPVLDRVVTSIRWELMREGAEDYDTLRMLEDLTARAKASGYTSEAEAGQAALDMARAAMEDSAPVYTKFTIADLTFPQVSGWSYSKETSRGLWLTHPGGAQSDLPVTIKNIATGDGKYEMSLNVYDSDNSNGRTYSTFAIDGKRITTAGEGALKGPADISAGIVDVVNGELSFTLSSVNEVTDTGLIGAVTVYRIDLRPFKDNAPSFESARSKVLEAIEMLQVER